MVPLALGLSACILGTGCDADKKTDERAAIVAVVENGVKAMVTKDLEAWSSYWIHGPESSVMYASPTMYRQHRGWEEVFAGAQMMVNNNNGLPVDFSQQDIQVEQSGNMAWVTFTQKDEAEGSEIWRDHTRVLKRTPDGWKLMHAGIVERSGYEAQEKQRQTARAEKMALKDFPTTMAFNHIPHWGGMTVAVNTFPTGMDFDPVLKGLPNDRCAAPHWGYLFKGEMELTHADGSRQTLKEGDLYYMPAGHTGKVIREAQLLEFGPDAPMHQVASHVEKFVKGQ